MTTGSGSHRALPNVFAGSYLDRRSDARDERDWLAAALEDRRTQFVVSRGTTQLVYAQTQARIAYLDRDHPYVASADEQRMLLLGWLDDVRCVLVDQEASEETPPPEGTTFEELRPLVSRLDEREASVLAYARALSIWRSRTRFCSACGSPTVSRSAGHVMRCSSERCAEQFFPRLDPAIIVLVSDGDRALLGRQSGWPQGRYSTIAGFVEPGESLEDAVAREVMEETGVRAFEATYRSSQPWPFPSSLMLGFHAIAAPGSTIRLSGELEDARWFTAKEIVEQKVMPTSHSISHRLISEWLAEQSR